MFSDPTFLTILLAIIGSLAVVGLATANDMRKDDK